MAVTQNTYTGDGTTVLFSFTFPYLETTDIKVSLNGTVTTAYTLANATTIQFNSAPANGAAIRIYRETDDSGLAATFYPGSAIRSNDLNDNFTQNLYVTQESSNNAATANTTANTALTNSNTAISTANSAVSTANTASSNASAAVATANTASSNASAAVSTANTASTNATAAVNTANSAAADAATAITTANSAVTTANAATATANAATATATTASNNASAAVSTANAATTTAGNAVTTANNAVTTANSAVTTAGNAVTTANNAVTTANSAVSTANSAVTTANAAASAVANAILYDTVANVAAIPATPSNNDAVEVVDSTGIESFTPLNGLPAGYVGDSGLSVRLVYTTSGNTWNWIQYFPNDPESRYGDAITTLQGDVTGLDNNKVAKAGDTMTGALGVTAGSAASPSVFVSGDTNTGIYSPGADQLALSTNGTGRLIVDASGNVEIAGTGKRIRGDFTSAPLSSRLSFQASGTDLSTVIQAIPNGTAASAQFRVFNSSDADNSGSGRFGCSASELFIESLPSGTGAHLPIVLTTGGSERLRITSAGLVGIGTSSPARRLESVETSSTGTGALRLRNDQASPLLDAGVWGSAASTYGGITANSAFLQATNANLALQTEGGAFPIIFAPNATERLRITSAGNVGIGTTSPSVPLEVNGSIYSKISTSGDAALAAVNSIASFFVLQQSDKVNLYTGAGQPIVFTNNNSERARIDSSGRLLVGTSSARSNFFNSTFTPGFQIEAPATDARMASIVCNAASAAGSYFILGKTRSASVGGTALVSAEDEIGSVDFQAADGSELVRAASIAAVVDGTPGANDMPGRLVFSTTADGASSPTERLRITSAGRTQVTGAYDGNITAVAALDIDCSLGNFFTKTVASSSTFTFSNVPASRSYAFILELTHTSGTITWPASVKWPADTPPTLTTGRTHLFVFVTDDGGSRWRGVANVDYVN